jgi:hypothetical protein
MGGWDVYCAICGSTFSSRLSINSDDETGAAYSGKVIGKSDLEWLQNICALGTNANILGERKSVLYFMNPHAYPNKYRSFVTGRGRYEDYVSHQLIMNNSEIS